MNIFVGNLSFAAKNEDVKKVFEGFGEVTLVSIKKKSGQNSRGFGFVIMPNDIEGEAAIAALQGKDFMGRPMEVTLQRAKPEKPKKDYKEIKRLRQEAKLKAVSTPKAAPVLVKEEKPMKYVKQDPDRKKPYRPYNNSEGETKDVKKERKIHKEMNKKSSPITGTKAWEKRIGTGTTKPWKKKPGGIKKKFKYDR